MDQHLDALDLARLAEGQISESVREDSVRHLARCRQCMALYAEFSRTHLDPSIQTQRSDHKWVRIGVEAITSLLPTSPPKPPSGRRQVRILIPSFAVLALVAVGLFVARSQLADSTPVPAATRAALSQLMREDSYKNLLYSDQLLPEVRGTRGNQGLPIDSHLDELRRQFEMHPEDAEVAFWLVSGALATGNRRLASTYLTDALRSFPHDPRFENLAGILAFKSDDLQGAEGHLRAAVTRDGTGVVKLNLVRVLTQQGRTREAEQLAEELRLQYPRFARAVEKSR